MHLSALYTCVILKVSFDDIETFNQRLATTILEEYYRVYPYICAALKIYIQDIGEDMPTNKDVFVSFIDVAAKAKLVSCCRILSTIDRPPLSQSYYHM